MRSGHSAWGTGWLCTGMSAVGRRLGGLRVGMCGLRAGLDTLHGGQGGCVPE